MKRNNNKIGRYGILFLVFFLGYVNLHAYDFEAGGLYYNILSNNTAKVTYGSTYYSGAITIPSSVSHGGHSYSVTSIGIDAFNGCIDLTSVTIPNSVTSIGDCAFSGCSCLTSITIPNSVTSIGIHAFYKCSGLSSITVDSRNPVYDSRNNCNAIIHTAYNELIAGCNKTVIPNSVTSIGNSAFRGCSGLTSITIPNSVTSIGDCAFYGCTGLTSITILNSVTSIGNCAFYDCSGLTSVTIPNSVTSIGDQAFYCCSGLTSITVDSGNPVYDSRNNCNAIIHTAYNELIAGCNKTVIPNSVTSIRSCAFYNCSGLASITIPNSVTSIGFLAFSGCSGLTSVTIPNSVTSIGESAFKYCRGLTSVTIGNSVTSIGGGAFYECSSLTSIISKITDPFSLGYNAFGNISKYATLTIPQGTKGLYENAGWTQFFSKVVESSIVEPTYQTIYVNGVTFKMIDIMGGTFLMGAQFNNRNGDNYDADADMSLYKESPVHEVTLSNYSIGETEVTQELWKAVMGTNPSMTATGNKKPVEYVTYNECQTFIQTLNQLTGKNFRLPTEAEWEFAARGGTQSNHYKWAGTSSATNVKNYVWYAGGTTPGYANGTTHDVKGKQPNELGIYDMSGNVWEWCADWYDPDYYSTSPQNDPKGPAMGNYHTVRGGSWNTNAKYCRVSTRNAKDEYYRDKEIGLRLALGESSTTTTYTLSISATGNGAAMYDVNYLRNSSWSFTVSEGTNAKITFTPDYGYRIKTVKVNGSTVTVNSNNQYTVSNIKANTTVSVEFEAIPVTTYTLTILADGGGKATYEGSTVRFGQREFTVNEGTSATISFVPDDGCRIKSVKVNGSTVSVSNNQYTISNINRNTTVVVEFELIPLTTYTLSITATGYGSASYYGNSIRGGVTGSFTVKEGTNATITFSPDNGYRIKTVKVNGSAVSVNSSNQYTVSNIKANTTVTVEFEAIPITTYTLSITATGYGSAYYNGTTVRSRTASLIVDEGTNATITFTPDNGYRIKTVKVNGSTVTVNSNNQYTVSNISRNTTVSVEFEAIPPTTYTLSISSFGNGSASYNGTTVRGKETSFTVNEGTNATITFSPDNGFRIKSVMVNNITVAVSNNQHTINNINRNTTVSVDFEAITYTFSISATGNGSAYYNGTTVRDRTHTFIMNEGTSATVYFYPDNGYRIKTVKINGATVNVSNNQYSINSLKQSTTVAVEFEAIPPTTYTLSITATGYGSASYNGTTVRGRTTSFTVNERTNATITFIPDNGYRIKTVKVNNAAVAVSNNQYTVSSISRNTIVNVEFEVIPPTTYTLSITATGNGSASYNGTTVRGRTTSFTVNEGTNATITFSPDNGYRVKSVMVNNLTVSVSNNQYTVSNISRNTTVSVEFEAIPPTTYTLSITATGYGSASYNGTTVRGRTTSFAVNEGTNATITFSPDAGYRIKTVKVNDAVVAVSNNQYTVSNISRNTTVSIEFEGAISEMAVDGVSYRVVSLDSRTINVSNGNYGEVLRVPATVSYEGLTFVVAGIESGALANATNLAAVVWEPATQFTESVSNPNLLLYVIRADYAPAGIQNVVVNGMAEHIVLTEAQNGNDFYCPEEFTARSISLTHKYSMVSGLESCQGWETIVLPFDVQSVTHATKGMLKPFATWQQSDRERPFWLYELGSGGWAQATGIRANIPYIISMPNNDRYRSDYRVNGNVTFSAENTRVKKTDDAVAITGGNKTLVPNFKQRSASNEVFALNVVNGYDSVTGGAAEGSQFVRQLRQVHPFEAYLQANNTTRGDVIPVFDDREATRIGATLNDKGEMINDKWYSVDGRKLEEKPTRKGVYIMNGEKVVIR